MIPSLRHSALALALVSLVASNASAVVQLVENADGGAGGVTGHLTGSYSLIQSDVVGQGTAAFHLAMPTQAANWFEINQAITVQSQSKLFFMSRLGLATANQKARVQISTAGNWNSPITLITQAGSDGPGEGAFSLRSFDLGSYVNQSIRFRFYYETVGPYYPQTGPGQGWYVDNIQIADQFQKTLYSVGDPSSYAQQYLEYINRARANAAAEANRLANETDVDVVNSYALTNITGQEIINDFADYINSGNPNRSIASVAQPLSFNSKLIQAATLHTQDSFDNQRQSHFSSNNPPAPFQPGYDPEDRIEAFGYDWQTYGENVFSYAESVRHGHAGFDVDWAESGFQDPAGHRISIHNPAFKEVGIGVVNGTTGEYGPQFVTQDFGTSGAGAFVTGVVYQDLNANNFYDIGEGRSGVRVDVDGSAYFAISSTSGAYSVPVGADGTYPVSFTGGGYNPFSANAIISGGLNVKIDDKVTIASFTADFDHDNDVDRFDLAKWKGDFGVNANSNADGDLDSDGNDLLHWQRQLGSGDGELMVTSGSVPEPASAVLALCCFASIARGEIAFLAKLRRKGGTP